MIRSICLVVVGLHLAILQSEESSFSQNLTSQHSLSCEKKRDGKYVISDVFAYLQCNNHKGSYKQCNKNEIFDPASLKCLDASNFSLEKFCIHRLVELRGNYRNPWDCHGFINCIYGISSAMKCAPSPIKLIYDPYTDMCSYESEKLKCKEVKSKVLTSTNDDSCTGKPDGDYPLKEVFKYTHCANGKASTVDCPKNSIFEPGQSKCVDISSQTPDTFCRNRTIGDWQSPWNCHQLFKCLHGISYIVPCQLPILVFDPYKDQCVYPNEYTCKEIKSEIRSADNPCEDKGDGDYEIADVFAYLQCANHVASYVSCDNDDVFDVKQKKCMSSSALSKDTFCKDRATGDHRDPWDCHKFAVCVHGVFSEKVCAEPDLVYDPYNGLCEYPYIFQCKEIKSSKEDDECKDKKDGNYAIADVFEYLTCAGGKATYGKCDQGTIFDATKGECTKIISESIATFCAKRADGDWGNPWNCYSYLSCKGGHATQKPCLINGFIYNPYLDVCVQAKDYPCKTATVNRKFGSPIKIKQNDKLCDGKKDGKYPVPDAFSYLQCTKEVGKIITCGKNMIFDHTQSKCVNGSTISNKTFCKNHKDGNYQNFWDCHSFISCVHGMMYKQPCPASLVYDPYFDLCEDPKSFHCNQLDSKNVFDSQCDDKKDGQYELADMFSFYECKDGKATNKTCPANQIFNSKQQKCVDASSLSKKTFCVDRATGDYQDPWDCHSYISCVHGDLIERPCSIKTLVYNPYDNICEYKSMYQCHMIKGEHFVKDDQNLSEINKKCHFTPGFIRSVTPCHEKKDGNYSLRSVFKYLICKDGKDTIFFCNSTAIYNPEPGVEKCVDPKEANIVVHNFCKYRCTGNFQDPWDCHSRITCVFGTSVKVACARPGIIVVYDPPVDSCNGIKCNQIKEATTTTEKSLISHNVGIKDICTTLPDGYYATRDVFRILQCSNKTSKYVDCPVGSIYIPGNGKTCTVSKNIKQENFCVNRTDGNWQDPWDCHSYFTCHAGYVYPRKCSPFVVLNYDPDNDICEYPQQRKCQQISKVAHYHKQTANSDDKLIKFTPEAAEPCLALPNGYYAISDVGVIMLCHFHHHHYIPCPKSQIYVPGGKRCSPLKNFNKDNFCKGRSDGNWRNPWNCHDYITCHAGQFFDMPCSKLAVLVYNPYANLCDYPSQYPCVNIGQLE